MATNITQKDKTLNEIIDWALSWNVMLAYDAKIEERAGDVLQAARYGGMAEAYGNVMEHCKAMLDYGGSTPRLSMEENMDSMQPSERSF